MIEGNQSSLTFDKISFENPNSCSYFTPKCRHLTINTKRYFELYSSLSQNGDCVSYHIYHLNSSTENLRY